MQINKFTKQRNGMYQILLEDNRKIKVHEDLILKYDLLLKRKIDEDLEDKIFEENKTYEIYEVALSYINKKLRSKKELKKYLERKEYSNELIDNVINLLYTQGYLNDEIYAKSLVHDRIALSMDGPNKIKKELSDNGINNSLIEEVTLEYTEDLEKERVEKLVDKQIKLNNNKGANLLKKKIQMYLLNLGYNYDTINRILNSKKMVDNDLYKKEYDKLYKTLSKKYSGKKLEYRLKNKLYQKGFSNEYYE